MRGNASETPAIFNQGLKSGSDEFLWEKPLLRFLKTIPCSSWFCHLEVGLFLHIIFLTGRASMCRWWLSIPSCGVLHGALTAGFIHWFVLISIFFLSRAVCSALLEESGWHKHLFFGNWPCYINSGALPKGWLWYISLLCLPYPR